MVHRRHRYRAGIAAFLGGGILVLSLLNISCVQQQHRSREIARVNDRVLTLEMIQAESDSAHPITDTQISLFANRWVTSELLYQEARQRGLDQSEAVKKNLEDAYKQLTIAALLEKEIYGDAPLSFPSEQIAAYYEAHKEEFLVNDDLIWISTVVFRDREPATRFRSSAISGAGWAANSQRYQTNPDMRKQILAWTDSIFYTQGMLYPPELWKVASALGTLEVSFPVKTSAGYFVLRSLGFFRKGSYAPQAYVEERIKGRLNIEMRQKNYSDFIETLRKKHSVQMYITAPDSTFQSK